MAKAVVPRAFTVTAAKSASACFEGPSGPPRAERYGSVSRRTPSITLRPRTRWRTSWARLSSAVPAGRERGGFPRNSHSAPTTAVARYRGGRTTATVSPRSATSRVGMRTCNGRRIGASRYGRARSERGPEFPLPTLGMLCGWPPWLDITGPGPAHDPGRLRLLAADEGERACPGLSGPPAQASRRRPRTTATHRGMPSRADGRDRRSARTVAPAAASARATSRAVGEAERPPAQHEKGAGEDHDLAQGERHDHPDPPVPEALLEDGISRIVEPAPHDDARDLRDGEAGPGPARVDGVPEQDVDEQEEEPRARRPGGPSLPARTPAEP